MGKNKIVFLCVLFFVICLSPIGKGTNYNTNKLRLEVQKVYTGESNVRELTGNNDGARILEYQKAAHIPAKSPYCAAGITWTFKQVGFKTVVSGYSPSWFPNRLVIYKKGQKITQVPDVGDVLGIWIKSKNRVGHVGFINENWNNGSAIINSFEFNTNGKGSDEGGGNHYLRRLKSQIHVISSPITKEK
jgi:hypothetical protein